MISHLPLTSHPVVAYNLNQPATRLANKTKRKIKNMSPVENTEATNAVENTSPVTSTDADAELKSVVKLADSLAATSRDKKNTAITLLTSTEEERNTISNFIRKVQLQADSAKKIYALSVAAARERNAGKPVPPSKQKKGKTAA
jgi:hypothetical protein